MKKTLIAPPAAMPVSLNDAKRHLRIETADADAEINLLIEYATARVEAIAGLQLISQIWRLHLDRWPPAGVLPIPLRPVQSIVRVAWTGADLEEHLIAPAALELDTVSEPAQLVLPAAGNTGVRFNAIAVDITAGFGDAVPDIPDLLKRAVLLLTAHAFENRGMADDLSALSEPVGLQALIQPFRTVRL